MRLRGLTAKSVTEPPSTSICRYRTKKRIRRFPWKIGLIKGSATILLVDDEEMIIDVGQAMLERLGYRVMVCRGGQEAVQAITNMGNEIDLVILDMIMPGMDGGTTFDRIREIRPGMPVLLSSGYAINGHAHEIMRQRMQWVHSKAI